jgi:hypothetical protein
VIEHSYIISCANIDLDDIFTALAGNAVYLHCERRDIMSRLWVWSPGFGIPTVLSLQVHPESDERPAKFIRPVSDPLRSASASEGALHESLITYSTRAWLELAENKCLLGRPLTFLLRFRGRRL